MSAMRSEPAPDAARRLLALAATFTAEPVQDALDFWMGELGLPMVVEFAPYGQVFQQLLDPTGLLSRNRRGVNMVLVRPEDWLRALPGSGESSRTDIRGHLERSAAELIDAARGMAA